MTILRLDTGYNIREGSELILARLLRDPANWPSIQEGSKELLRRYKVCPEDPSVLPSPSGGLLDEPDAAAVPLSASSGQFCRAAA